ncbi:hypothetical protein HJC23_004156 [Cyclotella cryptica]|uniref:Deacetylase sirtuin-type domain-containing protein n=1 Tax=Cyclotella cryptica TaxID=29204 RepID=A0ABD3NX67_9STRA|eukprot:CCRYP_018974-RA/>CCRYP_018974-RA protein AED:0.21 eAED:0.21 QI:164/1/1/1/1/1/3/1017/401
MISFQEISLLLVAFFNHSSVSHSIMPSLMRSRRRTRFDSGCLLRINLAFQPTHGIMWSSRCGGYSAIHSSHRILPLERPPDPSSLSSTHSVDYVKEAADHLRTWMKNKTSVLCLTGAGMSTESGIPDYRGHRGSYFQGHKPIVHHEFMSSEATRKRYWARSLLGYSPFANAEPNLGHKALASLEERGLIGVKVKKQDDHPQPSAVISTITQNVDVLHSKGGLKHVLHLHGVGNVVRCMKCGMTRDREAYHDELFEWNQKWLRKISKGIGNGANDSELRPDGDAVMLVDSYDEMILPGCQSCGVAEIMKTDVVFFGDSIPQDRVDLANRAVDAADGLLCIGTSLAVHSAFRLAKRAIERGIPVAILNVGQTRIEKEKLEVTKVDSPIGETLHELVKMMENEK